MCSSHYIYVITIHQQLALSYTIETSCDSMHPCVHSHFTLLPTHLYSLMSQLQLCLDYRYMVSNGSLFEEPGVLCNSSSSCRFRFALQYLQVLHMVYTVRRFFSGPMDQTSYSCAISSVTIEYCQCQGCYYFYNSYLLFLIQLQCSIHPLVSHSSRHLEFPAVVLC